MNVKHSFHNLLSLQRKIFRYFTVVYTPNYVYHFYVDFKGLMYFDDTTPFIFPNAIKDRKFIEFFYKNIKKNPELYSSEDSNGKKYQYVSQFWGEKNYLRCAIAPIIFNFLDFQQELLEFSLGQSCKFDPRKLKIDQNGLLWHPYILDLSKTSKKKQKNQEQQSQLFRNQLMGVFSNELTTQILDDVVCEGKETTFSFKKQIYSISKI